MEHEFFWQVGAIAISGTVITTWGIMVFLIGIAWLVKRRLTLEPTASQTLMESIFTMIEESIMDVAPEHGRMIMPFIATLWVFLVVANLLGLIPELHSPTRDLSLTSALAILVFLSVHYYGIKVNGLKKYLHHYLAPTPVLLPFHIMSEFTRTLALAVRLFGNIMSLETAALLVLMLAGFLAPVPLLMLHIIEALVQAYIFGMLALVYLAGAIQSQQPDSQEESHK